MSLPLTTALRRRLDPDLRLRFGVTRLTGLLTTLSPENPFGNFLGMSLNKAGDCCGSGGGGGGGGSGGGGGLKETGIGGAKLRPL